MNRHVEDADLMRKHKGVRWEGVKTYLGLVRYYLHRFPRGTQSAWTTARFRNFSDLQEQSHLEHQPHAHFIQACKQTFDRSNSEV